MAIPSAYTKRFAATIITPADVPEGVFYADIAMTHIHCDIITAILEDGREIKFSITESIDVDKHSRVLFDPLDDTMHFLPPDPTRWNTTKSDRSLSTSTLENLGTVLKEHLPKDAVHLATCTAVTAGWFTPGCRVGIKNGRVSPIYRPHIGIIDPFIQEESIPQDSIVIVMLYPKTVSEVRHVWDHEQIDAELELRSGGGMSYPVPELNRVSAL